MGQRSNLVSWYRDTADIFNTNICTSDVIGEKSDIDFYVYDRSSQEGSQEAFLGHVRVSPDIAEDNKTSEGWYKLEPRDKQGETVTGELRIQMRFQKTDKKHYGPEDFQILKLIGKGKPHYPSSRSFGH